VHLADRLRRHVLSTPGVLALAQRILPGIDLRLLRITGGRFALTPRGARALVLTTRGRRSGIPRSTPVLYTEDGPHYLVVASNWGQPHPPNWLLNLRAEPAATVHIGRSQHSVVATELTRAERTAVWARLVRSWPLYAELAARAAAGELPVVRLSIV
jgi:deazaflavin-dependent oxidoreductase (nitroreductase family)